MDQVPKNCDISRNVEGEVYLCNVCIFGFHAKEQNHDQGLATKTSQDTQDWVPVSACT